EPAERGGARLRGVPVAPDVRQEQVAELDPARRARGLVLAVVGVERDQPDHVAVAVHHEVSRASLRHGGHRPLDLLARQRPAEVGVDLRRGVQLHHHVAVGGVGLAQQQPLGPDRRRRPRDASEVYHPGTIAGPRRRSAEGPSGSVSGGAYVRCMALRIEELSPENIADVLRLPPQPGDDEPVAPTAWSVAEAYVQPTAWPRAVTDDGEVVGF